MKSGFTDGDMTAPTAAVCLAAPALTQTPLTNGAFWMIYQRMIKNAHITSTYFWLYL